MKKTLIDIGASQPMGVEINQRFNPLSNVVGSCYQKELSIAIEGLKKICINLHNRIEATDKVYNYKGFFGVCLIDRYIDFDTHFAKTKVERQYEILKILQESLMKMCDKFNFDKTPFDAAYQKVIENNFEYRNVMNKMASAKNRQHKAGIEVDLKEDGAQINVLFTNKNSQPVVRRELIKLKADYYFINQLINKGKWLDNERYMVSDKNEVANFIAQLNSDKVELQICPRNTTTEQVLERIEGLKA